MGEETNRLADRRRNLRAELPQSPQLAATLTPSVAASWWGGGGAALEASGCVHTQDLMPRCPWLHSSHADKAAAAQAGVLNLRPPWPPSAQAVKVGATAAPSDGQAAGHVTAPD